MAQGSHISHVNPIKRYKQTVEIVFQATLPMQGHAILNKKQSKVPLRTKRPVALVSMVFSKMNMSTTPGEKMGALWSRGHEMKLTQQSNWPRFEPGSG